MNMSRFIPVLLIGSLMTAGAFAAQGMNHVHTNMGSGFLTTDEVAAIQKECSDENNGSTTSRAYQDCVKEKEDTIMSKKAHHHQHHGNQ